MIFLFVAAIQHAHAQVNLPLQTDSSFELLRTYEGDIADAALDRLGYLYIISSKGQVKKFSPEGDSVAVYSQVKNSGQLFTLDVSNPLKILLFYKDFPSVVILDRYLAIVGNVDLRKCAILQPGAIGLSYDNNIWVFDEYDNKLKKIDEQGNHLFESSDFRSVFGQGISPQKIISDNRLVYLADSAAGVFVFDNYGTFKKKIALTSWQSIAVVNNHVISTGSDRITVFNTSTMLQSDKKPPFTPYFRSFANADRFVSFSTGKLNIYHYRF